MNEYEKQIQRSIDYIETALAEKVSLTDLAMVAGFSDYHYHRVFHMMTGDTVMEYVRKRRLARAAYDISHTDEKILDIALTYGFQSHETLTRAFKKLFEMTPSEYRKRGIHAPVYPKIDVMKYQLHSYLGGIKMDYRIETKPGFDLIGYAMETSMKGEKNQKDIPAFWQDYLQKGLGDKIPYRVHTNEYVELGLCTDYNFEAGSITYIIGMEATSLENVPEGMIGRSFPETTYAVFTTPKVEKEEFVASIQQTWQKIFAEWFPHSGYEHAGTFEFERYDEKCHEDKNDLLQIEIHIPVRKVTK
ncbi:AraC family transcriptional regulator [Priestia taiwanensis]|uniref:AraC family transcriptional regulator n=1 Tax=Priestia taiwanensis TaxID=1347902 RepID=A0A917ART9_9BACI|nr:AraC family transcriptional regulator [Priestia taiwanensis]MBM7363967.1 AraC family transcriptional regulator [Priestia taiwanensis]GGE70564.1 AraC family transcriptional regulator [Priestia taiwanensis]